MATKTKSRAGSNAGPSSGRGGEPGPAAYAKEAIDQWKAAARMAAVAARGAGAVGGDATEAGAAGAKRARSAAKATASDDRDDTADAPAQPGATRRAAGTVADWALSKLGPPGRLASKLSLGSRAVGAHPSQDDEEPDTSSGARVADDDEVASVPIQQALNVAVPIGLAYQLALELEAYPNFLEHAESVAMVSDTEAEFEAKLHGSSQLVAIEIFDTRENERIDWRSTAGLEHAGTVSFHELAPRLTHVELSVDVEPQGLVGRVNRALRISDRSVLTEMRRFKAYAELYEAPEDSEFEAQDEPAEPGDEDFDEEGDADEEEELADEEDNTAAR